MANDFIKQRCPACPRTNQPIRGNGPQPSKILCVGEAPGREENKEGHVFCGPTGQELNEMYLARFARLDRNDIRVCNAMSCAPPPAKGKPIGTPTAEQARSCAEFFVLDEIRRCQPDVVVLLGAVAVHALLPPESGLDIDMETHHGYPFRNVPLMGYENYRATVVPMYHPAAGLHDTRWMQALQEDFTRLGEWLRGEWAPPVDSWAGQEQYVEVKTAREVEDYFWQYSLAQDDPVPYWCGVDTEFEDDVPFCVTASTYPGTGIFIDAENKEALTELRHWLVERAPLDGGCSVVYHNANADMPILRQLGIDPPCWTDTMQGAFDCGMFRIGLKILAWRLLGMKMQEYDDVVTPHSKLELYDYLIRGDGPIEALTVLTAPPAKVPHVKGQKRVKQPKYVPSEEVKAAKKVLTKLKRLAGDMEKGWDAIKPWDRVYGKGRRHKHAEPEMLEDAAGILDSIVDLRDKDEGRAQGWAEWELQVIARAAGGVGVPRKSIRHVPRKQAVHYAVRDADATLRLRTVIEKEMRRMRWERKII